MIVLDCIFAVILMWYRVCFSPDESKHDKEGRVITAEYDKFFFVAACRFTVLILFYINITVLIHVITSSRILNFVPVKCYN